MFINHIPYVSKIVLSLLISKLFYRKFNLKFHYKVVFPKAKYNSLGYHPYRSNEFQLFDCIM